jgi:hypothetical protein
MLIYTDLFLSIRPDMTDEEPTPDSQTDEMASEIIKAVRQEESATSKEEALSKAETEVEKGKERERIRKAKELRKQMRKREMGFLNYRWPAGVLLLSAVLAFFTEFLTIWVQEEPVYGFYTFWEAFTTPSSTSIFWLFPVISGILMIILAYFSYSRPRATYWAVIPAMLMAMAGSQVYFLVTAAYTAAEIAGTPINFDFGVTGTPLEMVIIALLAILSIAVREKE